MYCFRKLACVILDRYHRCSLGIRQMAGSSTKRFPLYAKDYELFEEVGEGVSATVYRARCIALNENVAIKIMDLEKCRNDLVCVSPIF